MKKKIRIIEKKVYDFITFLLCRIKGIPQIYVIGDSHTKSFQKSRPFIVHHLGAATAYNLGGKKSSTKSFHKLFSIVRKINKKKDILLLVFGEIDCRIHIYRQFINNNKKIALIEFIDIIINKYFEVINELKKKNFNIVVYGIPPANKQANVYNYDYYASTEIQYKIKNIFNQQLKKKCKVNGLKYLEVFNHFADNEGFILEEYSEDEIHLNNKIINTIKTWFNREMNVNI